MSTLTIVLPYKGVDKLWYHWAESEREVDFRRNRFEADRCTSCFAALELKNFINKRDDQCNVQASEIKPDEGRFIKLKIGEEDTSGGFKMTPSGNGLIIAGHDRGGLLNGVYEFLRMQGWRWTEPGIRGEYCPDYSEMKWPEKEIEIIPSFKFRGLDAYRESQDSVEYMLWMARNRLNVCFRKAATGKFGDKLGMYSRTGGHLIDRIVWPNRYLETGKTIREEHPEWYGLQDDGTHGEKDQRIPQLCVSQSDLLEFMSSELLELLNGEFNDVDIVDVWGFDGGGHICSCLDCQELGNGADHNLLLLSVLRKNLDKAGKDGSLDRKVLLDIAAYEGTETLEGPTKPLPENLLNSGDVCIYYPIRRCYRHDVDDKSCDVNKKYNDTWLEWNKNAKGMPIWIGEYYNVSRYEDLPLLFTKRIPHDMRFYHAAGGHGSTYMHAICVNWGMRSLTQMQHAQYSWDINTNDEDFMNDYFQSRYGDYALEMRKAYVLIEEAGADIAAWRNWEIGVLQLLNCWDGNIPEKQLKFIHFQSVDEAVSAAEHSIESYRQSIDIIEKLLESEQAENWKNLPALGYIPATPQELESFYTFDHIEYRMGESRRLLKYGIDTMRILLSLINYHDALFYKNSVKADEYWEEIEKVAKEMSAYFLPISFDKRGVGLISHDALTRTQHRPLIARCRRSRASTHK